MPSKRQQILVPKFQWEIFLLKVYSEDIKHIARTFETQCPSYMGSTMARTFGANIVRGKISREQYSDDIYAISPRYMVPTNILPSATV